jgi:hypothetical protein
MEGSQESYKSDNNTKRHSTFFGIRTDRLIFIICLFVATLFWLLIKLSDVYTVNYSFRINYDNAPPSLRLTQVIDTTIDVSLTGRGFAILKMNIFNDMDNLDLDLYDFSIDHKEGVLYSIDTKELVSKIAELANIAENNVALSRTVLTFQMETTGEKIVEVFPNYNISFSKQYDLYNSVKTNPDVVKVFGPQSILDTLSGIFTKRLVLVDISTDQKIEVDLNNPNPELLTFDDNIVTMDFEVEKFTESELVVPINLSNLDYSINTFPSQVKVYYRVAQKDFNEVRPHQFNIFPIVDNMDILHAHKLPLKVSKHPDFVRNLRVVPSEVEFLIIK